MLEHIPYGTFIFFGVSAYLWLLHQFLTIRLIDLLIPGRLFLLVSVLRDPADLVTYTNICTRFFVSDSCDSSGKYLILGIEGSGD